MNEIECADIIDRVKSYWVGYQIEGNTLSLWMKVLKRYVHDSTRRIISDLYREWERPGKPPAGAIFARLKAMAEREPRRPNYEAEERPVEYETDPTKWGPIRCWLEDKLERRDRGEGPGPTLSEMIRKAGF